MLVMMAGMQVLLLLLLLLPLLLTSVELHCMHLLARLRAAWMIASSLFAVPYELLAAVCCSTDSP
jgi:hypothetical protein